VQFRKKNIKVAFPGRVYTLRM